MVIFARRWYGPKFMINNALKTLKFYSKTSKNLLLISVTKQLLGLFTMLKESF